MLQRAGETTRSTASSTQGVHQTGQRPRTSSGRSELDWPGMGTSPHSIKRLRNTMQTGPSSMVRTFQMVEAYHKNVQKNRSIELIDSEEHRGSVYAKATHRGRH